MTLRVALVGGPMYDPLYRLLDEEDVEIVVHADHPTLNREVARRLGAGERLDLISTHAKYAPSQADWLTPLDDEVDASLLDALAPRATDLCRVRGRLLSVPRNLDVRVLWVHRDRVARVPDTWDELARGDATFGFPGRESGLFGTFFEIVVAHGGRLFDDGGRPTMVSPEATHAVELLKTLADRVSGALPTWHYDEVDRALVQKHVDMAAMWPGGWAAIRSSPFRDTLAPHPYPAGPAGRFTYSGCHSWAIPRTCGDRGGALALLHRFAGSEGARREAENGGATAHVATFADAAATAEDDTDRRRLELTRRAIAEQMITYPPLSRFPEIEDAGWSAIREALLGERTPAEAVREVQKTAERVLAT